MPAQALLVASRHVAPLSSWHFSGIYPYNPGICPYQPQKRNRIVTDVGTSCLCIDLRSAAQRLTRVYDEAMAPSGISVTQFSLLHRIQTLEAPTLGRLAEATGLDRSTLGRNLRVLERQGLVRLAAGDDARTRTARLTKRGARVFAAAAPLWYQVQKQLVERIGSDGRSQLDTLLQSLTEPATDFERPTSAARPGG